MTISKSCQSCGSEIPGEARFCPQCGTALALGCSACGHVNAAGSRFCAQCGTKLVNSAVPPAPAPVVVPKPTPLVRPDAGAERRQLTVMFCDLVGSTALSTRLDPEDLREVIAAYHNCTAEVVTRFGGYVAKFMGDGVLVYFGYPEAHETDAGNALRAGLALVKAVSKLFAEGRHKVRIGIATGLVVVGELIGSGSAQERNVVGETPNLAARLQSNAAPNTVVIAATTWRLAGEHFDYEAIEPTMLKGFDEPVRAWRVLRERAIASRFEAIRAANLTPLVGRDEEMEMLLRRWQHIKNGEGRVVLLSGEPGIGKSKLTAGLEIRLKPETHICLRYFCQPHHQGSALQPVLAHLAHAADFEPDETPALQRAKLEKLLGATGAETEPFAELLGLSSHKPADGVMDPQRARRAILSGLLQRLDALARQSPVLMLFEDVHWADPTSIELLTLTIERVQTLPVLLIVTFRPDYQPPWVGLPHVTALALNRLGRRERTQLVEHITGGKSLPPEVLDQIVDRTDGVPLFVEELTKAVLESEQLYEDRDRYVLDQPIQQLAIPATLQDSLMARVDRLGSAREVLQIGAAIGRDFSHEVLAAVAGLPDAVLQDALARLAEAELVFMRGSPPNATYTFKHALVQDTAYSTMLRQRRQQLHTAIALVLEKRFPEVVNNTPQVIAQQFESAGRPQEAVAYWRKAGERYLRRFAMKESIAHYSNALRLVLAMPESRERDALELEVLLGLGLVQQIAYGPTAEDAAKHYKRALALSADRPEPGRERFLATWGLWFNATVRGDGMRAIELSDQLVTIARELDNSSFLMEAYHAKIPMLLKLPDFAGMKEAANVVIERYDRERHRDHAYYFGGHDARMCARSFLAWALWGQGLLDQASDMAWQSIEDARQLGHVFSVAHALQRGGMTMMLVKDAAACRLISDELYTLSERNNFAWQMLDALFMRGWLAARSGDYENAIPPMVNSARQPMFASFRPTYLVQIAEAELSAGDFEQARATLLQASQSVETGVMHFCEPEIHRLRGETLMLQSRDKHREAESSFRDALSLAAKQQCRPLELRAAASMARLLAETGRRAEGRDLLARAYAGFKEGFERPDLAAAKALLSQLS